jgi:hypothetical protein
LSRLGLAVSGSLFDVLGIRAALGRTFVAGEDSPSGRESVIVLSHDTWTQLFGSDPDIIGQRISVGGE